MNKKNVKKFVLSYYSKDNKFAVKVVNEILSAGKAVECVEYAEEIIRDLSQSDFLNSDSGNRLYKKYCVDILEVFEAEAELVSSETIEITNFIPRDIMKTAYNFIAEKFLYLKD